MTSTDLTKPNIPVPFADNIKSSVGSVPTGDPGQDNTNSNMCWYGGFPSVYGLPLDDGGKYVTRTEMNAILRSLSQCLFYTQNGGVPRYDADVSTAIGGYPLGAVLWFDSNIGTIAIQAVANGTTTAPSNTNIDMDGSHGSDTANYPWRKVGFGALPITGGTMSGDNISISKAGSGYLQLKGGVSGAPGHVFVTGNGEAALRSGDGSGVNDNQIHVDQSGAWANGNHIVTGVSVNGGSTIYAGSSGVANITIPQGSMVSSIQGDLNNRHVLYQYMNAGEEFVVPSQINGSAISSLLIVAIAYIEWDEQATVSLILEDGDDIPRIGSRVDGANVAPTIPFTAVMAPGTKLIFRHQRGRAGHMEIHGFK